MRHNIVLGIDIGTSAIKAVVAEKRDGEKTPFILGMGISQSHGLRKGFIINPNDVAIAIKRAVKQAQEKANTNLRHAFVSIDGAGIESVRSKGSIVVSRADHEITENDLKRALNQSENQLSRNYSSYLLNREILHTFPIAYKIDEEGVIENPLGMRGEKLEVETLFITSSSQHLNNLIKSIDLAGITIEDITAAPWAMSHSLLDQKEGEVGCLLLNIGGDVSSIIVFEEGLPISMEILPIGSNHITYDIAKGFQILLEEAEELKFSYSSDVSLKRKLSTVVEPRLNDIFELTENHLGKIKRAGLLPAGVILTGGGANLAGIDEMAKKSLKLPSQLSCSKLPEDYKNEAANPIWSVALGLCLSALGEKDDSIVGDKKFGSKIKNTLSRWLKVFLP